MRSAHTYYRTGSFDSFSDALKQSWNNAKFRNAVKANVDLLRKVNIISNGQRFESVYEFGMYILKVQASGSSIGMIGTNYHIGFGDNAKSFDELEDRNNIKNIQFQVYGPTNKYSELSYGKLD
ncbi:hypothetical protein LJC52_04515 [Bacteroidales bacterium OttesenSCG-928-A17]|nr:hypothetical protein [Bacteroidales bacterium OttesenSCG-928-A17]